VNLGLEGRAVVCTGATGAIGRATAQVLAEEGARLLLVDRDAGALDALAATLPEGRHATLACDLRDPRAATTIVARSLAELGALDVLAHLAAIMVPRDLDDVDLALWDAHQEVNVRGAFLLSRAAAQAMRSGRGGSIVLVSSAAWLTGGRPDRLHYAVTKGAITTLVRGLAGALGPDGIRVNGVAPGMVDTPMMEAGLVPGERRALERDAPLRRFAEPREIANVIAFVAGSAASYVSGATIAVTGGQVPH
jgi:NAD(P)-dependent dehydrogenase (short-subunit alcohol dehydrogenase family)